MEVKVQIGLFHPWGWNGVFTHGNIGFTQSRVSFKIIIGQISNIYSIGTASMSLPYSLKFTYANDKLLFNKTQKKPTANLPIDHTATTGYPLRHDTRTRQRHVPNNQGMFHLVESRRPLSTSNTETRSKKYSNRHPYMSHATAPFS